MTAIILTSSTVALFVTFPTKSLIDSRNTCNIHWYNIYIIHVAHYSQLSIDFLPVWISCSIRRQLHQLLFSHLQLHYIVMLDLLLVNQISKKSVTYTINVYCNIVCTVLHLIYHWILHFGHYNTHHPKLHFLHTYEYLIGEERDKTRHNIIFKCLF